MKDVTFHGISCKKKKRFRNLNLFIYRKEGIVIRRIIKLQISLDSGFEILDKTFFKRADLWYPTYFHSSNYPAYPAVSLYASILIIGSRQTCFTNEKKESSLGDLECYTQHPRSKETAHFFSINK